jgi:DNA-binding protein YbaB
MFKNITQFASAMKNLSQLGPQVQLMQEKLEAARVYGSSYDILGTVHVEMSGLGVVLSTSISSTLLESSHQNLTQRLVTEAMNEANRKAKELHVSSIRDITGGADLIPGFNDLLKNISG